MFQCKCFHIMWGALIQPKVITAAKREMATIRVPLLTLKTSIIKLMNNDDRMNKERPNKNVQCLWMESVQQRLQHVEPLKSFLS